MKLDHLLLLNRYRTQRRLCAVIIDLTSHRERFVGGEDFASDELAPYLLQQQQRGKSALIEWQGQEYFIALYSPAIRLILIGAVHISQALIPMAQLAGYECIVIDPRQGFASRERFPNVLLLDQWPQQALDAIQLDENCAVALLTHDSKIDDPALEMALSARCLYIGALGSRKTHMARLERMKQAGICHDQMKSIHAPIGLDIGAVSPAEIAVSILAEIVLSLRKKPLREALQS